ncbi:PREDICTED: cysteine-rich receptor-like protein kinase 10 [Prunus mume]|uniref:Cysteine-rich receptor-like protein kinase 10 n=1 Tax=Prunus mume TaxID=102107 RepID=A0ABM1LMB0_PRUMU|nr:PREDICTED: cysteine-rich receptor-like protein kinase 10 [Prunus mume]
MVSSRFLSLLFPILLLIATHQAFAQEDWLAYQSHLCSNNKGNYTTNSTYHRNLNTLLSSLPSNNTGNGYGFYNSSYGQSSDDNQVYAIALCYMVNIDDPGCRNCLNVSRYALIELCPNQKEAVFFTHGCMLRYSNSLIYGTMETTPSLCMSNTQDVPSSTVNEFFQKLRELLGSLRSETAAAGSLRKFAYGNTSGENIQTIYGLTQCTPDLSEQECNDCLIGAFGNLCSNGKIGGRVIRPSCYFMYEVYPYINISAVKPLPSVPSPPLSSPPISPPPPSTTGNSEGSNRSRNVVIIVVSIVVSLLLIISICICLRVRKTKKKLEILPAEDVDEIGNAESLQMDFDTIRLATDDFSEVNKLGQGGFGSVYKGKLFNGENIAVKRLSMNSGQGDIEFQNEVLLVARLQHRNLVRLLGFCLEGQERLLVYEFVSNASLDRIIFDPIKRAELDWDRRYKIIVGITRGLLYLHEDSRLRIIHRDLKVSNILIDGEMNPKIADFGMARLFVPDQTQANTKRIVGTYGYMSPEYAMHGHFSVKSDVYSFGVLTLEIISGQKISDFQRGENVEDLLSYAWKNWVKGTASNLIDPTLRIGSRSEMMRCIHIGLLCVQENAADRPTMASIIVMLNSYSLVLPVPSPPSFVMHSNTEFKTPLWALDSNSDDQSQSNSTKVSVNETTISDLYPR